MAEKIIADMEKIAAFFLRKDKALNMYPEMLFKYDLTSITTLMP